uniref:Uncharacterized protein n=1 Tax=Entomoneis paludosa TaxID=265537 RepID=A0A6U3CNI5_9STRA
MRLQNVLVTASWCTMTPWCRHSKDDPFLLSPADPCQQDFQGFKQLLLPEEIAVQRHKHSIHMRSLTKKVWCCFVSFSAHSQYKMVGEEQFRSPTLFGGMVD